MSLIDMSMKRRSNFVGAAGELLVASEFYKLGYEVFFPIGGKSACDFIAYNNFELLRVEVKSVNSSVGKLTRQYRLTHGNFFDVDKCDILAAYIVPMDTVCYLASWELREMGTKIYMRSREEVINYGYHRVDTHYIEDYISLQRAVKAVGADPCWF